MSKQRARIGSLKRLSDKDLLARLKKLRGTEREVQLNILYHLGEIDRRRLYLSLGYGSIFEFCRGHLRYSGSAAGRRIRAARCVGRFPRVAYMFAAGEINLTAIALISGILNTENAGEILSWVKGRPFREIEMLVSRHRPERYLRDRVRPVCIMAENTRIGVRTESTEGTARSGKSAPAASCNIAGSTHAVSQTGFVNAHLGGEKANSTPNVGSEKIPTIHNAHDEKKPVRFEITQKFQIQFAVEPEFMEMLERILTLLPAKHTQKGRFEAVFTILMEYYLDRNDPESRIKKRKQRSDRKKEYVSRGNGTGSEKNRTEMRRKSHGTQVEQAETATPKPRDVKKTGKKRRAAERTRHIPQAIRDEVFVRDGGRCAFIGTKGRRCGETRNLEIDHIIPYAKGGSNSPDNLRLLCAKHNQFEAEREYGKNHMKKYSRRE